MPVTRVASLWLGSLLLIAPTTARSAPAPDDGAPAGPDPAAPEKRHAEHINLGNAGVGFAAPHKDDQLHAIRQILAAGDDDWARLSPKIAKVIAARINLNTGAGMYWTRSNKEKATFKPAIARPDTPSGKAMQGVRDAAADNTAADDVIAAKLAAVREARKQAREEYEAAEEELIAALTPRQQAVLMTLGVVE